MTITVVAASNYDAYAPRVTVTVTASPSITAPLVISRVHPDGSVWPLLSEVDPQIIGGTWVGFDYHAPLNVFVTYRAVAAGQTGVSLGTIVPAGENMVWLIHPSDPALSVLADRVMEFADPVHPSSAVGMKIMGSQFPVHQNDSPRMAPSGSITVACDSPAAVDAMEALLADGGPILLNTSWPTDLTWLWVQPGDTSPTWPVTNMLAYPSRRYVIPYQATTQPDIDLTALWTDADLKATGWTSAQAVTHYANDAGMKIDSRIA